MPSDDYPDISLVIPAWNESAWLPGLLETVDEARARYSGGADAVEVIVGDNGSTDGTADVARTRGCRVVQVQRRCIASARNGGAAAARGEVLAFADADFRIHPETFNHIRDVMGHPGFLGGATGLTMARWSAGVVVTWLTIMPPLWLAGLDGGVWFCRQSDFRLVGGFDESLRAGEDVRFLRALQRLGRRRRPGEALATRFSARRMGLLPALAVGSCRKFDQKGDWFLVAETLRGLLWLAVSRRKLEQLIQRNWYEGRE